MIFLIALGQSIFGGGQAKCLFINCYNNPSGPAVAWPTIVAVAQSKIAEIDKTATLHNVSAAPVAYRPPNWSYDKVLNVEFRYVSPEGNDISIEMRDDAPTSTLKVTRRQAFDQSFYAGLASRQEEYARRLAAVKLGPRAAGELTWQGVVEHASGRKLSPLITLNLENESPYWSITYSDTDKGIFEFWDMWFEVDAQTGQILKADYKPFIEQLVEITPIP